MLHPAFLHFDENILNGFRRPVMGDRAKMPQSGKVAEGAFRSEKSHLVLLLGRAAGGNDLVKDAAQGLFWESAAVFLQQTGVDGLLPLWVPRRQVRGGLEPANVFGAVRTSCCVISSSSLSISSMRSRTWAMFVFGSVIGQCAACAALSSRFVG